MHIWGRIGPRVGSGRVRLFVGNRGSGRVNVLPGRVGSGRVQEKWPVDNSGSLDEVDVTLGRQLGDSPARETISPRTDNRKRRNRFN